MTLITHHRKINLYKVIGVENLTTYAGARATNKLQTVDLVYCALFATLMMIGANITAFMPFMVVGGVPITLQSFFATLAGLVLGPKKGAIAMTVYILIGLAGAPVFAQFKGGISTILSPTFGFLLVFVLIAYVLGKMTENKNTVKQYVFASLVGTVITYIIGTNWMYGAYMLWFDAPEGFNYWMAWAWMLGPLPKDIILGVFAGFFAFRINNILKLKKS